MSAGSLTIVIPGLAMAAAEMPQRAGHLTLENPEVGTGSQLAGEYTIEAVASAHAATIRRLAATGQRVHRVIGLSMGGMIAAVLATEHADAFAPEARFSFFATSANTPQNPAVTQELLTTFGKARPLDVASFAEALAPLFSPGYLTAHAEDASRYFAYRARGENGMTARAYFRQVGAVRGFDGTRYFPRLVGRRVDFTAGTADRLFGAAHVEDLRRLVPDAAWRLVADAGHMLNLERPELFADA